MKQTWKPLLRPREGDSQDDALLGELLALAESAAAPGELCPLGDEFYPEHAQLLAELDDFLGLGPPQKGRKWLRFVSNCLFYMVIIGAVVMAVVSTGKNSGGPQNFFGFSYFTVRSSSMQQEIPKGSFIITRKTDPNELQIGDNITFLKSRSATVTHKIVGIREDHDGRGNRAFQTRGVNNASPDRDLVSAENVVGKVVFAVPGVGTALELVSDHLLVSFAVLGLLLALSFGLQVFFRGRKDVLPKLRI